MLSVYVDTVLWRVALTQLLARFHKGAIWWPFSALRVGELPEPDVPGPQWVKLRVHSCGLCGSDMHYIQLEFNPKICLTAIPGTDRIFVGHEVYGEIVEVGEHVTTLKKGDMVTYRIHMPACEPMGIDPCPHCAEGNYTLCTQPHKGTLPPNRGGGFSEYMVVHQSQLARLPDDFTEDQALMTEPVAAAVHAVFKHVPGPGDRVLIIGGGTLGLNVLQVLKAIQPEASVTSMVRYPAQEELARRFGADDIIMGGDSYRAVADRTRSPLFEGMMHSRMILGGYDLVHDTVGSGGTFQDALRWVKGKGVVVLSGIQFAPSNIDFTPIWHQEITVTGINCHGQERFGDTSRTSFDWAIELIQQGKVKTRPFITHRFPIARLRQAVETMTRKGREPTFKIVLDIG